MGQAGKTLKVVALDGILSFFWTLITSSVGVAAFLIGEYMDIKGDRTPIMIALLIAVNMVFAEASFSLGGAAWNPTAPLALYTVGVSEDTILMVLMRMPVMALGAAGGILAATNTMPSTYRPLMGSGPQLKTDFYTGALAEGVLTFAINLVVLYVILRATKNRFLQTSMILTTALVLVQQGAKYTGPALNPSDAFGWAYLNKTTTSAEQLIVYWLSPLLGTVAAAWLYRGLFGSPRDSVAAEAKEKQKTS